MKVYIHSCHAALEYDHALIFYENGFEVCGLFDYGSKQRPKIPGITDWDAPGPVHERAKGLGMLPEDTQGADVIVLHQTPDYPAKALAYSLFGPPVIVTIFGQGNLEMHSLMVKVLQERKNVFCVVYSKKEYTIYVDMLGAPADQVRLIRFAKPPSEFSPELWTGEDPVCFLPCNDIHHRGGGCGWELIKELVADGKILLGGHNTEEVGGLGELTYDQLKEQYKKVALYLSIGTIPAPYTLTFVEAISSGTPLIAHDNGAGIAGEGFDVPLLSGDPLGFRTAIENYLSNPRARMDAHMRSVDLTDNVFSWELACSRWGDLFERAIV